MSGADKRRRRAALLRRDGPQCWICGRPFAEGETPTIDHMIPLKLGGSDALPNLRLAHGLCNQMRSNPPLGRRRVAADDDAAPQPPRAPGADQEPAGGQG